MLLIWYLTPSFGFYKECSLCPRLINPARKKYYFSFPFEIAEYTFRTGSYVRGVVENQIQKIMSLLLNRKKSVLVENKLLQALSRI